jgi:hypothetical protein
MLVILAVLLNFFAIGDEYDVYDEICELFGKKECESGPCVWENDRTGCLFDRCFVSVLKNGSCPSGCEVIGDGAGMKAYVPVSSSCRREGAYIDHCFFTYSINNYKGNMSRCEANSSCEVYEPGSKFFKLLDDIGVPDILGTTKICLSKDRNVGSHEKGAYNYDITCGLLNSTICEGGPCVWTNNGCVVDPCLFTIDWDDDNTHVSCGNGCSAIGVPILGGIICEKTGKVLDSCFFEYTTFSNFLITDIQGCQKDSTCTTLDLPLLYSDFETQLCVSKGITSSNALIENRRFGAVVGMMLLLIVLFI